ncbi:MAG: hypothetical protein ACM3JD_18785, partial [Rudaea sp.]
MNINFKWFLLVAAVAFLVTACAFVYVIQPPVATASAARWPMDVLNRLGVSPGPKIPKFDHIFVLVEENRNSTQVIGNAQAPYINTLATQGSLATNYFAVHSSSLP